MCRTACATSRSPAPSLLVATATVTSCHLCWMCDPSGTGRAGMNHAENSARDHKDPRRIDFRLQNRNLPIFDIAKRRLPNLLGGVVLDDLYGVPAAKVTKSTSDLSALNTSNPGTVIWHSPGWHPRGRCHVDHTNRRPSPRPQIGFTNRRELIYKPKPKSVDAR